MIDDIFLYSVLGFFLLFAMYGVQLFQEWLDPPKTYRQISEEEHPEDCNCTLCQVVEIPKKADALLYHPDSCACKYCIANLLREVTDEIQQLRQLQEEEQEIREKNENN